ncbi:MAG: T9SS type A sorting domain-containing protein [Saprospiraceae bacterium]
MSSKYQLTGDEQSDIDDYNAMVSILSGQPIYSLDDITLQAVFDYLDGKGYAGAWAKNIATLYGRHYPPSYIKEGQGWQLIQDRPTQETEMQEEFVNIFPNPAKEFVNFALNLPQGSTNVHIRIYDLNGRLVKQQSGLEAKDIFIWHTDEYAPGIYYYTLIAGNAIRQDGKLILSK